MKEENIYTGKIKKGVEGGDQEIAMIVQLNVER
jgi:hypothetical protein